MCQDLLQGYVVTGYRWLIVGLEIKDLSVISL